MALDSDATATHANGHVIGPLTDQSTHENVNDSTMDAVNIAGAQVKVENVPLYEIHTRNSDEIDALLDEPDEVRYCDSDDDLTMIIPKNGIPKPLAATSDNVIKREDDLISGSIPFNTNVSVLNYEIVILQKKDSPYEFSILFLFFLFRAEVECTKSVNNLFWCRKKQLRN